MSKSGIKVLDDYPGSGRPIQKGDRVRLYYDVALNREDIIVENQEAVWTVGDRNFAAGFPYGLEGMRIGGTRKFKASPHLCYRDEKVTGIPRNSVLIVTIRKLEFADRQNEK